MTERRSFLFVHSPLTGPYLWKPVADELSRGPHEVAVATLTSPAAIRTTYWGHHVDEVLQAARRLGASPVVVVAHSGGGPLMPALGAVLRQRVDGYVFVDAALPLPEGGSRLDGFAVQDERDEFRSHAVDGFIQPWPEPMLAHLIPDAERRRQLMDELRPLPLAVYEERIPGVPGWPSAPCSYIRLSAAYEPEATQAAQLGWEVSRVKGGHFHMLLEPAEVAEAILSAVSAGALEPPLSISDTSGPLRAGRQERERG